MIASAAFRWSIPCVVFLTTSTAFLPAVSNEFVGWDDEEALLRNPSFRGLSWRHLAWMFTTFHTGHYQPLSWVTFALDYSISGLNPVGYHLTNVLLHAANAVACYAVGRRLLALALPDAHRQQSWPAVSSAAFAALFFALHPLRVESVAWVTERRDVLSGFFYLWTIYAYLRAHEYPADRSRLSRHWMAAALVLYPLSLLSKATAMTLPVVLLLLDVYPLRRCVWNFQQWFAPDMRKVWREKIPFVVLALAFAFIALLSQREAAALKSFESYGLGPELRRATEIDPLYAKGYFNLGRVLSRSGDFEGAWANLRKALELSPNEVEIHLALGAVWCVKDGGPTRERDLKKPSG